MISVQRPLSSRMLAFLRRSSRYIATHPWVAMLVRRLNHEGMRLAVLVSGVYRAYFRRLLAALQRCEPIVEIGAGPSLLKSEAPFVVSTDVVELPWLDLVSDAASLPFRSGGVGGIVMVDVLHHLPRPLRFLSEAARVLRPGGRIAAIEPWISPISYLMYRWIHHEQCRLSVDLDRPLGDEMKGALERRYPVQAAAEHEEAASPLSASGASRSRIWPPWGSRLADHCLPSRSGWRRCWSVWATPSCVGSRRPARWRLLRGLTIAPVLPPPWVSLAGSARRILEIGCGAWLGLQN